MFLYPPVLLSKTDRPSRRLPLGIAYLASWIEHRMPDMAVTIFDALIEGFTKSHPEGDRIYWGVPQEEIVENVMNTQPDVLAISCQFSVQSGIVSKLCAQIKERIPDVIIVAGGPHASSHSAEMLKETPQLDYIIAGEGELAFETFIRFLSGSETASNVTGLVYRDDEDIQKNDVRFMPDINMLPFPAWHLLNMEKYRGEVTSRWLQSSAPSVNMITSRGCPFKCSFCGIQVASGKKFRARTAESVLAEVDILVNKYGFREIHFEDDNMTLNRRRAEEIFDGLISRDYRIEWAAPSGLAIWTLDEPLIAKMKQSGCIGANIAIESGNAFTLRRIINKPLEYQKVEEVAKILKRHHIPTTGFWVIGLPGETRRMMWESLDYCRHLGLDNNQIAAAYAYKGTRLYDICKANNFVGDYDPNRVTIRDPRIRTPEFSPKTISVLLAADRFIAVNQKEKYRRLPYRMKELWQREKSRSFLVILELIRHGTIDRLLTAKGLEGKVYTADKTSTARSNDIDNRTCGIAAEDRVPGESR